MISEELYARLATLVDDGTNSGTLAAVYDTKLPDGDIPPADLAVVVFQCISDTPLVRTIQGTIPLRDSLWQVSVRALDIHTARNAKEAIIASLHGYTGTLIRWASFESAPGEIFEGDYVPPQYHIPIDFTITQ